MFKQRFLTAIILIPLVFLGIYYANDLMLAAIIGVLGGVMAWEWTALMPLKTSMQKALFIGVLAFGIAPIYPFLMINLTINMLLWVGILAAVVTYPKTRSFWGHRWLMIGVAWFLLTLFAHCLWGLFHIEHGRWLLVYLLGLVWATDIGAYMFGKLWGKHRLIPQVSPGKTIEGSAGGLLLSLGIVILGLWFFHPHHAVNWIIQGLVVIGISMLGDLWISMLKRRVQLKDTGHILPGHGGLLDRLDSLVACLPFFYYFSVSYS